MAAGRLRTLLGSIAAVTAAVPLLLAGAVAQDLERSPTDGAIEGADWRLAGGAAAVMRLADGVAIIADACGQVSLGYTLGPESPGPRALRFGEVDGPELCPTDGGILTALARTSTFVLEGDELTLVDAAAVPTLVFTRSTPTEVRPAGAWRASGFDFTGAGLAAPRPGSELTVTFGADGRLEGTSACGGFVGAYSVDAEIVSIAVHTTGVAECGARSRDEEFEFTTALQTAASWRATANGLDLVDDDGLTRVQLVAIERGSVEGDWTVLRFATPNGRLIEPVPGSAVRLRLTADGEVEGSSGCRLFDGRYVIDGAGIVIAPVSPIGQPCRGDLRRQERRFLAAFERIAGWERDGTTLELRDGVGQTLMELVERTAD